MKFHTGSPQSCLGLFIGNVVEAARNPLPLDVGESSQQLMGLVCKFDIQTLLDLPRAEHLVDHEHAVAFGDDLSIAQRLLGEPFKGSHQGGILSHVVGHEFALAVDLRAFPNLLIVVVDDGKKLCHQGSWARKHHRSKQCGSSKNSFQKIGATGSTYKCAAEPVWLEVY